MTTIYLIRHSKSIGINKVKKINTIQELMELSVKDAARKLGISEQAVRKHIQNKKLVAQMNSRHNYTITPMALREFMSNRKKND